MASLEESDLSDAERSGAEGSGAERSEADDRRGKWTGANPEPIIYKCPITEKRERGERKNS